MKSRDYIPMFIVLLVTLVFSYVPVVHAQAQIHGNPHQTVSPEAYSKHDFLKELHEFNQRTLVGDYLKHGVRNPRWDALAQELLNRYAVLFTYNALHGWEYRRDAIHSMEQEFRDAGELSALLIEAQCSDPMILYLIGVYYQETLGQEDDAVALYRRANEAFKDTSYSACRKYSCADRLLKSNTNRVPPPRQVEKRKAWEQERLSLIKEMLGLFPKAVAEAGLEASQGVKGFIINLACSPVYRLANVIPPRSRVEFYEEYLRSLEEIKATQPWAYHTARGNLLISLAWVHRGSGFAHTVKPEQWEAFGQKMEQAYKDLLTAWQVTPSSLIANNMITLAMAGHTPPDQNERYWFKQSIRIMFDDGVAWQSMEQALLPRWGGSHAAMAELAIEAVNTGRFDTATPWRAIRILNTIERERRDAAVWAIPEVKDAVERLVRGMEGEPKQVNEGKEVWWPLFRAAAYCKARDYKRARVAMDDTNFTVDQQAQELAPDAFSTVGLDSRVAIGQIYLLTSQHGEKAIQAIADLQAANRGQAIQTLEGLAEDQAIHPIARDYLNDTLGAVEFNDAYATNNWIKLVAGDDPLSQWEQVYGEWSVDDEGRLIGQADEQGLMLLFKHETSGAWLIRCDIEILSPGQASWVNAGVITRYNADRDLDGFWVYPRQSALASNWQSWNPPHRIGAIKADGINKLQINHAKAGIMTVSVNKAPSRFNGQPSLPSRRFGLSAIAKVRGDSGPIYEGFDTLKVRYSNIEIRKVK